MHVRGVLCPKEEGVREMQAVVMAGGKGTRLFSVTKNEIPKPMVPLCGRPVLEHQIRCLGENGVTEVYLLTGHLGEAIEGYFGDGSRWGMEIYYIREDQPLGTAGALGRLRGRVAGDFLLVFGDLVFDIDIRRFLEFHKGCGALCTLLVHPNSHPYDSDIVQIDGRGRVVNLLPKGRPRRNAYSNLVNSGLYMLSPCVLDGISGFEKMDMEKDIIAPMVESKGAVYGYKSTEYVRDMGTPERLEETAADIRCGIAAMKNLGRKQKCVFLDRDGTVNRYAGLLAGENGLELEDGAAKAVRLLNASPCLAIIITNQPVVARGMCSIGTVKNIHKRLETMLGEEGAYVDDILFCPHHPDKGYPGEDARYKIACACRKPGTGMIDACVEKYNIDRGLSWMVGDTTVDIQTGKNAGMKSALVLTGEGGKDKKYDAVPDMIGGSLLEVVKKILGV